MKKSLQGPLYFVVFFFLIFSSATAFASGSRDDVPGRRKTATALSFRTLTLVAPTDITIHTDPWLDVATGVSLGKPVVTGTDSAIGYTVSNDAPDRFPIGTTRVTWKVTDTQGNTATALQQVTVVDDEKPFVYRNYEISVVNDPGKCGAVVSLSPPEYYDNSGPVTFSNDAPAFFEVGTRLITWTATDRYGNSDTSTQLVTVIDNEQPTISIADITVNNEPGKCGAAVSLGTPSVSDNCGIASIENNAPAFFATGTTMVCWTVTDKSGYTSTTWQKVVVQDTEKPQISTPAPLTLFNSPGICGYSGEIAPPVVTDNCGIASIRNNAPGVLPIGTTQITWTATDHSGNLSFATQSITVKDLEPPVFVSVPASITVGCGGVPLVTNPSVRDNCTASPTLGFSETSTKGTDPSKPSRYNYTVTRTWTARDAAGNVATAKQVITVQDQVAPSITVPANITRSNDNNTCGAVVSFTAYASDGCGSPVMLTYSKAPGTQFPVGTTSVTVTAKDVSGNTASKTFLVTVNDIQKPVVRAPGNVSVSTSSTSVARSSVNLGTPLYNDNCGVKTVTNDAPAYFPLGITTVTWTVTDVNNNLNTSTQTVTVASTVKRRNEVETGGIGAIHPGKDILPAELSVIVSPNPTTSYFTLRIQSGNPQTIHLRVTDVQGRVVEARNKLGTNSTVQVGFNYPPGLYFAELIQGPEKKLVRLLKLK